MEITNHQLNDPDSSKEAVFTWALPVLTILAVLAIIIRYVFIKKHCPSSKDTISNLQISASHSSPSSSSSPNTSSWDVFLSFHGKDTRSNFIAHLYFALDQAGIQTFRDNPVLIKGEEISSGLHDAIRSSKKFVVVISENYARSSWCLDELVKILSCDRTKNQVVPVFYYVHPSDLRHQKGSFGEALDFHKKRYSVDKIEKWRSALAEIADLSGHHLKKDADENESDIIQEIVGNVALQVLTKVLHLEEYLYGVDTAVEKIYKKLSIQSNDFRVIGIWGMGGIGKTTTAKAFYNRYLNNFDISCFVENVKQNSKHSSPLLSLLEQLLSELHKRKDYKVLDIESGMRQLKQILSSKKALVVLDDLDQSSHSELLVTICNLFTGGSRVIVTTRDLNLLNQLRVDISKVYIHKVKELDQEVSLQLFSHHAFRKTTPPRYLRELSVKIVNYVGGLPLALKVMGSSLRGRTDVSFWKSQLEKVRENPEIIEILKLSYDELCDKKEKAIFLDIVFFFIGKDVNEGVHVFKSCEFCPEAGIPILVERCLLTVDQDNRFQMHSLIQDMGREVMLAEAKHGKSRRLHLEGSACLTLQNLEGTDSIEGLVLNLTMTEEHVSSKIFERLPNLRLLEIIDANIKGNITNSFHELRCIRWSHCPWTHLPVNFRPQKLVSLDMPFNKFKTLPKGIMNLKIVDVSYSKNLKNTFDLRDLKSVEKLLLRGCKCLLEVHPSIGQLTYLSHLDLGKCNNLKELPESIGQLTKLNRLDLDECEHLTKLPEAIGQLNELGRLELHGCHSLKILPKPIEQLTNLVRLDMRSCHNLKRLPDQLGNMKGLKMIDLSDTAIEELPNSIAQLKKLIQLKLMRCVKLRKLPEQFGDMEGLCRFDASCSAVEQLPDSFCRLINLDYLDLSNCNNLIYLPKNIWKLQLLRTLDLHDSSKFKQLPEQLGNMQCLEVLFAGDTSIEELPESIGRLSRLHTLTLDGCKKLRKLPEQFGDLESLCKFDASSSAVEQLPDSFCRLINLLRTLDLHDSSKFKQLPEQLGNMQCLEVLFAGDTSIEELPESIGRLSRLHTLTLDGCKKLRKLPEQFGDLESLCKFDASSSAVEQLPDSFCRLINLVHLHLSGCKSLIDLPNNIWKLKLLRRLNLTGSSELKQLPEQLGNMQCLEVLKARDTSIEELPDSIGRLSNLRYLDLNRCKKLKYMPKSIGNLPSLARLLVQCETLGIDKPNTVKLTKLENLYATCDVRLSLPVILELSSLKSLNLRHEGHTFSSTQPFCLSELFNLRYLRLENCTSLGSSLTELPPNIEELIIINHATLEHLPYLSNLKKLQLCDCLRFHSLQTLPPHLHSLKVVDCASLHDPPDLSMLKELTALIFFRCRNLKSIGVQQSFLQSRGRLSFTDYIPNTFTAYIPNRKIPEWFSYKRSGNTISFEILPNLGDNFLGVALWVVYKCKTTGPLTHIKAVITNKTEGLKMNHAMRVRTDTVGEVNSRVQCISRDGMSYSVHLGKRGSRKEHISVKCGDRIKVQFERFLNDDDRGPYGRQSLSGEVKVEMCGAHVVQKTPLPLDYHLH